MKTTIKTLALSAVASAFLVGCGGGGSSSSDTSTSSTVSGSAVDGYLKNSTVCLDLNLNGICDVATEPTTLTGENGAYSLTIKPEHKSHINYNKAPLIVYGGVDQDNPTVDYTGKLKSPNDGSGKVNLTVTTTLVSSYLENNSSKGIKEAKQKVADIFGIDVAKVDADPRANGGDAELIKIEMQMQSIVEVMAKSALEDNSNVSKDESDIKDDIFKALAAGLDNVNTGNTIEDTISNIVTNAPEDKLKAISDNTVKAKDVAKASAKNVALVLEGLDTAKLSDTISKTFVLKDQALDTIAKADFTQVKVDSTNLEMTKNEIENIDFELESKKLVLKNLDVNITDLNDTDIKNMTISLDMDTTELDTALQDNTHYQAIKVKIVEKEQEQKDKVEAFDKEKQLATAYQNAKDLKGKFEALDNNSTMQTATVADAKNLFTQLRETADSLYSDDNNATTIISSQDKLITDEIKPAIQTITDNLNASATALETSFDAFDQSVNTDFNTVLTAVETRINALTKARADYAQANNLADIDEADWSITAGSDTLSHTFVKDSNNLVTESFTFNGTEVTSTWTYGDNGDDDIGTINLTSPLNFKGDGYDLNITSLSFLNNKAIFNSSATITGDNGATMELSDFSISLDYNELKDRPDNVEFVFDGTIKSNNRTLDGKLIISETKNEISLIGKYTGASGEPSFDGTITAKGDSVKFKDIIEEQDNHTYSHRDGSLMTLTKDGLEEIVISRYTPNSNYNINNNTITLKTNNYETTCNTTAQYISDINSNNVNSCDKNVTLKTYNYYELQDKYVTIDLDSTTYQLDDVWSHGGIPDDMGIYTGMYLDGYGDWGIAYDDSTGNSSFLGANATVSNFKIRDAKTFDELNFDISFDGTITDGNKNISLTLGVKNNTQDNLQTVYAENINITDGDSVVKLTKLTATTNENNTDNSIKVEGAEVSIMSTENQLLTFDANFEASESSNQKTIKFNGEYSYAGTTFKGVVEGDENITTSTTSGNVSGEITATGYKPFTLSAVLDENTTTSNGYVLFTRDGGYLLAGHITGTKTENQDETTTFKFVDSNGVILNVKSEPNKKDTGTITDKDGKNLGEFASENSWEIKYSDNTTETIF
jgi:hypothetical protein